MISSASYYGSQRARNGRVVCTNGRITIHYTDGVATVIPRLQMDGISAEIAEMNSGQRPTIGIIAGWVALRLGMVVWYTPVPSFSKFGGPRTNFP